MNPKTHIILYFLTAILSLIWGTTLQAQTFGETVLIRTPVVHDLYTAGRHIEILAEVKGDLTAAGQVIKVNEPIRGDVIAAGEIIDLRAIVSDDVRAAGRQVIISNQVGDHLIAAGESVSLESGGSTGGWAWLAGDTVRISGQIGQELKAAARRVIISGEVLGDVDLIAEQIEILDGAHIHGDLIWRSEQAPQIGTQALIDGRTIERPIPEHMESDESAPLGFFAFFAVSLMATGVVIYLLFPQMTEQASVIIQHKPLLSLGLGLAVLFITPLMIVLLFVTTIGSLLALALLASYLVLILLAVIIGTFVVGDIGLRLSGKGEAPGKGLRITAFVIAIILLGLLQLIPVVDVIIELAVLLSGLGGLSFMIYRGRQHLSMSGS